jgi:GH15 family glucan-1,4-alpha-glucosidase
VHAITRRYRPDTLILETEIACDGGRVRVIDFMPPGATTDHDVIRIVEGLDGAVPIHVDMKVRFAYGRLIPWINCSRHRATLTSGPDALALDGQPHRPPRSKGRSAPSRSTSTTRRRASRRTS